MRFVFADSLDQVDPTFDFDTERRSETRVRQRADLYPHEIFQHAPYDGMLVSKAIVDGVGGSASGRYTVAQRQRLLREGVRAFLRLRDPSMFVMGDCGAFTYVRDERPPFSAEQVAEFYAGCGFDFGISVDHVILAYDPAFDGGLGGLNAAPAPWRERQELTISLAAEFMDVVRRRRMKFQPLGVAQGWSPHSYQHAVGELQKIGYRYIAIGGLVPLKTPEIVGALQGANSARRHDTHFHLLGITRLGQVAEFKAMGAVSFDTTSPLRQAFKDSRDNYHTLDGAYTALRVPQVEGNPRLQRRIRAGEVDLGRARKMEQRVLQLLSAFDRDEAQLEETLAALLEYDALCEEGRGLESQYRDTLSSRPWRACPCEICRRLGIHVAIFRGAERNRRRGFHNLFVLRERLEALASTAVTHLEPVAATGAGSSLHRSEHP